VLLPMSLLFRLDGPSIGMVFTAAMFWGYFIHLNLKLSLGVFTGLFGGPQYHRIHHSIEHVHHNHNFAALFPVWDRLFGTQYLPASNEWPATGITQRPQANSWPHALFGPFIAWAHAIRLRLSRKPV
jgi:sterol desaturase/sphingolipid hydroxylase (fatty acid hydroxylase superfamily)